MLIALVYSIFFGLSCNAGPTGGGVGKVSFSDDVKRIWRNEDLALCVKSDRLATDGMGYTKLNEKLFCHQQLLHHRQFEFIKWEVLNQHGPSLLRLVDFVPRELLSSIASRFAEDESAWERDKYFTNQWRVAKALWLDHRELVTLPYYDRLGRVLALNLAIAAPFLLLRYSQKEGGHNTPTWDYHDMGPNAKPVLDSEGHDWFAHLGQRFVTAQLVVTANGDAISATVFPRLQIALRAQPGDVLLWTNADSNNVREDASIHGECPFSVDGSPHAGGDRLGRGKFPKGPHLNNGEKLNVVLWIHAHYQDAMKCSLRDAGYDAEQLLRLGKIAQKRRDLDWMHVTNDQIEL